MRPRTFVPCFVGATLIFICAEAQYSGNWMACAAAESASTQPTTRDSQTGRPSAESTVSRLQHKWIKQWAYRTDPRLGKKYEEYLAVANLPRGPAFEALVTQIGFTAAASESLSGENCLEMLGPPDFWGEAPDGHAVLVYLYTDDRSQRMEVVISVNAKGMVGKLGWNWAGINDYVKLGLHH